MADRHPDRRNRVILTTRNIQNVFGVEDPRAFGALKIDNSLTLESFKKKMKMQIIEESDDKIVFDVIGIDAPLANALRRIMLAEVPKMAIETVNIYQNTSIMQDEVLAHRLGLIPIKADPRMFSFVHEHKDLEMNESNTLVFTLDITCEANPQANANSPPDKLYKNSDVYSGDLKWIPQGSQEEKFGDDGIRPVLNDIIITKLRPGQQIEAELLVEKGIGKDHAKWSPVCTASYRLHPAIVFKREVKGNEAETLKRLCPMGVFDIEDLGGTKVARARYPRNCSMCRECIRGEERAKNIELQRIRDHFIFSVESDGAYRARDIVTEALKVLKGKATKIRNELEELYKQDPNV
mmetsp:Transcript_25329/g.61004  ORF Transcript_25329/g.61004 Transcript_25329/m.61004 type:complete len:351 (-) Transcript_25329:213-1265(-)